MPTIGVIAGDGVGPEVVARGPGGAAEAAARDGFRYETRPVRPGRRALPEDRRGACPTPSSTELRRCDALFLGAVGPSRRSPPGVLEKGILLRLRFEFHQYVNLRPVRLYPGRRDPDQGEGARRHRHGRRPREQRRPLRRRRRASPARGRPRRSRSRPRSTPGPGSSAACGSPSTWRGRGASQRPFPRP